MNFCYFTTHLFEISQSTASFPLNCSSFIPTNYEGMFLYCKQLQRRWESKNWKKKYCDVQLSFFILFIKKKQYKSILVYWAAVDEYWLECVWKNLNFVLGWSSSCCFYWCMGWIFSQFITWSWEFLRNERKKLRTRSKKLEEKSSKKIFEKFYLLNKKSHPWQLIHHLHQRQQSNLHNESHPSYLITQRRTVNVIRIHSIIYLLILA